MKTKTVKGVQVPSIGLGTFELTGPEGTRAIRDAIDIGYRHIDTAVRYGNEREVGTAIRDSGVRRQDLFVTTKIWFDSLTPEKIQASTRESLDRLQLDYVDLLMVHWPTTDVPLAETLAAFADEKAARRTKLIGVSNFTTALLHEAIDTHRADLFANQVEYHPFLAQDRVLEVIRQSGMLLTAYLPLARATVFGSDVLREIGEKYGKSAAQVTLRWLVQQPNVAAIPRSLKTQNLRSNLDIFDFELDALEVARIKALASGRRMIDLDWSPEWDKD